MKTSTGSGATLPVQSIKACVVYDTSDGRIHHQHRVLTLQGGREPAEAEMAADALRHLGTAYASRRAALAILHVQHDALNPASHYRVDPQRKVLVAD
jgi:hypothetical protein